MKSRHCGSPLRAAFALVVCALCVRRAGADPAPAEASDGGPPSESASSVPGAPPPAPPSDAGMSDAAAPTASAEPAADGGVHESEAAPAPAPSSASAAPDAGPAPSKSESKPSLGTGIQPANPGQTAGMVTILAGSLTTFAGLYLWLDSDARTAKVQTSCVKQSDTYWLCPESSHADLDRAHTENVAGMTGTAVGALLISVGTYLWLHHEPPETTAFVGPNGVVIRGRF